MDCSILDISVRQGILRLRGAPAVCSPERVNPVADGLVCLLDSFASIGSCPYCRLGVIATCPEPWGTFG